jgi:aminoglycoside phosphotransferase (APT) family kinase protein
VGQTVTTTIHPIDGNALELWLTANLPGYAGPLTVEPIFGGQSNPTYILRTPTAAYVLRKKPPGELLPSAHAIDREYRVMSALAGSGVPVPRQLAYCSDRDVIGTEFIIMEHVAGRVFRDPQLSGLEPSDRAAIYDAMNVMLANLHGIDITTIGLTDFGKPQDYCARQTARWTKQYRASETRPMAAMEALIAWLPQHIPADQTAALVHGDFRLENLIIDAEQPKVVAVIDWELATVGHPLADLAHSCMLYHLPQAAFGGFVGTDIAQLGIPDEPAYLAAYCRRRGLDGIPDWRFYMAFALFRLAAIMQGVYARALQDNASSPDALERGAKAELCAECSWALASGR